MPKAGEHHAVQKKNLVGFRVGDVPYAIDIQRVREVIKPLSTWPVPQAPPSLIGVADHHGDVIPIIDLRLRFGVSARTSPRKPMWIIVKRADRHAGLVVDRVTEVFGADQSQQREIPNVRLGEAARGIVSVCAHRGALVFVLDVDRVTDVAEDIDLSAVHALIHSEDSHGRR